MLSLNRFLMRIKACVFHVLSCAFRVTTMRADVEIVITHNHQGIIHRGLHRELISFMRDEGILLHDLSLRISNIEVIASINLIRLVHRYIFGLGVGHESFSRFDGDLPARAFYDLVTGNTFFSTGSWFDRTIIPSLTGWILTLSDIRRLPVLTCCLRKFANIPAGIEFSISHNLRIWRVFRNSKLQVSDHLQFFIRWSIRVLI